MCDFETFNFMLRDGIFVRVWFRNLETAFDDTFERRYNVDF
jgi:hypothetical protein